MVKIILKSTLEILKAGHKVKSVIILIRSRVGTVSI